MTEGASVHERRQWRALFYVFDGGTGIGHLRRLARLAEVLQGSFACLLVTGHRTAAEWFVPTECEYVHLPAWDTLLESKASYWGRRPFLDVDVGGAVRLRREIIAGVLRGFEPDVIFVDHLPLGAEGELATFIESSAARKYLITRGVQNETMDLASLLLEGDARHALEHHYDRVFAAVDRRVFDFGAHFDLGAAIREKTEHTGYISAPITSAQIAASRRARGLGPEDLWVVASAGGGQLGEPLLERCLEVARRHAGVAFDVVVGPRSRLEWADTNQTSIVDGRLRVHRGSSAMPQMNASADIVISSAGYNTLMEAIQGRNRILCFPLRPNDKDEQFVHATRLKEFVDIEVSNHLSELPTMLERALADGNRLGADRREELRVDGAAEIAQLVVEDLVRCR